MNWNDLQYFLSIAQEGSIRAAARALSVDHATLSRHMRDLQDELGVRLLERRGRSIMLSPSGLELLEAVEGVDDKLVAVARRLSGRDTGLTGEVRVALPWTLARLLARSLPEFVTEFDGLRLQLATGLDHASLTRREADIAVRVSDKPSDTLVGRRVGALEVAAFGQDALLDRLEPCELVDYPWIGWDDKRSAWPMETWLRSELPLSRRRLAVDSEDAFLSLVCEGAGVGFVASALCAGAQNLRRLAVPTPVFSSSVWVLTHADVRAVPRIRATTTWLVDRLAECLQPR